MALTVLAPVVVIAYFALAQALSSSKLRDDADRLVKLAGLGARLSALVPELQKQRGMSAGYIGSGGASFRANLSTQRDHTEAARSALTEYLKSFDGKVLDRGAASELATIRNELNRAGSRSGPDTHRLGQFKHPLRGPEASNSSTADEMFPVNGARPKPMRGSVQVAGIKGASSAPGDNGTISQWPRCP